MPGLPIGPVELIIILVIALLVLGPGKLPEVGSAFGKTIREFRKASTDFQEATDLERPVAARDSGAVREPATASEPVSATATPVTAGVASANVPGEPTTQAAHRDEGRR